MHHARVQVHGFGLVARSIKAGDGKRFAGQNIARAFSALSRPGHARIIAVEPAQFLSIDVPGCIQIITFEHGLRDVGITAFPVRDHQGQLGARDRGARRQVEVGEFQQSPFFISGLAGFHFDIRPQNTRGFGYARIAPFNILIGDGGVLRACVTAHALLINSA